MLEAVKWISSIVLAIFFLIVFGSILVASSGILLIISLIFGIGFAVFILAALIKDYFENS